VKKIITSLAAIFFAACMQAQQEPKQENDTAQFLPKAWQARSLCTEDTSGWAEGPDFTTAASFAFS
jgi:hypothetical protein